MLAGVLQYSMDYIKVKVLLCKNDKLSNSSVETRDSE